MKKFFVLTAAAVAFGATVANAYPPPQLLDDSAAFTIARAVKLGDSDGDYGTAPTVSATKKTNLKKNDCKTDSDCPSSQKCSAGKCEDVCTSSTCSGETPDCSADNHKSVCKCTENSCGSGKKCADGQCVPCSVGDKCGCSGAQVIVSGGKCGCSASTTCPAGQYKTDDCSCRNCAKDDTYNRCGCVAPLVPNGSGGCYCKETTCAAGNSFSTSSCGCVPCTDNASCQYPCANGQAPDGKGGCVVVDACANVTCSGDLVCSNGACVCPSDRPYWDGSSCQPCLQDSQCGTNKYCYDNGAGARSCDDDCSAVCPVGYREGGQMPNLPAGNAPDGKTIKTSGTCNGRPCWGYFDSSAPSTGTKTCEEINSNYISGTGSWMSDCANSGGKPTQIDVPTSKTGKCFICQKDNSSSCKTEAEVKKYCNDKGVGIATTNGTQNGKACYSCFAYCANLSPAGTYFTKGKGNCPSGKIEIDAKKAGADGKCYACGTDSCENHGMTSDSSKSPQPNFVATTINGKKCYVLTGSGTSSGGTSSSCSKKCSPSSAGTYRAGSKVCFFGNSFSKNAWTASGGCCDYVYCQTVPTGNYCQVGSDGILVGGVCPRE